MTSLEDLLTADRQSMLSEICDLQRQVREVQRDLLEENRQLKEQLGALSEAATQKLNRVKSHRESTFQLLIRKYSISAPR